MVYSTYSELDVAGHLGLIIRSKEIIVFITVFLDNLIVIDGVTDLVCPW